jgi:hypothetical protein
MLPSFRFPGNADPVMHSGNRLQRISYPCLSDFEDQL